MVLAAVALVYIVSAKDYPLAQLRQTTSATLLSATEDATGTALDVEHVTYHTFQFILACTNNTVTILDRSLDGSRWVPFHTNSVDATSIADTTLVGKWAAVRARFVETDDTNSTCTVLYLGQ